MYDRQFLLDIKSKSFCDEGHRGNVLRELGLQRGTGTDPNPSPGVLPPVAPTRRHRKRCERTRKRGKRAGVRKRLIAKPHRSAVPSILLANVRSLDLQMDYIRLSRASKHSVRDCCATVYTETWLDENIKDDAIQLEGLTLHRADRVLAAAEKLRRSGRVAVYVN